MEDSTKDVTAGKGSGGLAYVLGIEEGNAEAMVFVFELSLWLVAGVKWVWRVER